MPLLPCGSRHGILLFLISFIEIVRQKSLLITSKFTSNHYKWDGVGNVLIRKHWTIEGAEECCIATEEGERCVHCAGVRVELFCVNESAQLDLFFLRLTQSGPKCWTQKCKVYRRNTPERTLWNLLALSIFTSTAPGSMCPNWNPQLIKAIDTMDFWGYCCFAAHFDFQWRGPLQHWWLINCKIVCRMNRERNDMLIEILTFQMYIFIE